MTNPANDIEKGAVNLLENCAGTRAGDRLLVVHEPADLQYYDSGMIDRVAEAGRLIGANVRLVEAPFDPDASELPKDLEEELHSSDQTVFLARIGDQIRFSDIGRNRRVVVSYALSRKLLGCEFGTADYEGFVDLKDAIDRLLAQSENIHVSCPAGTAFSGKAPTDHAVGGDVSIRRFPMLVFTPVLADNFSGKAAMPGFLVGTGSKYYKPYVQHFDGQVLAHFENRRITGFEGSDVDVKRAEDHYRFVSEKFGIDSGFIHSWHAGMHPGCHYDQPAGENYERWSGAAFGNPRILHFHTCGAYAPGEISWNIIDPTVSIDGVNIWENGTLHAERIPGGSEIMARNPSVRSAFENPSREIGL
jgi:hypothetical protein